MFDMVYELDSSCSPNSCLFVVFGVRLFFKDNLFHPHCSSPNRVASCACGVGRPSSGSGGDGEGGEECATGAQ